MGRVVVAFLAVYFIWGSTYFALARGVETIPPLLLGGIRYSIAGAVMAGAGALRGAKMPTRGHLRSAVILGFLFFLCGNGGVTWAEAIGLPSSAAALMCATAPLFTAGIAALFPGSKPVGWMAAVGLFLGFGGVALLVLPNGDGSSMATAPQVAAVLAASIAWSFGSVLAPRLGRPESMMSWAGIQMLAGGAWMLSGSAAFGELSGFDFGTISLRSASAVLYLIVFGSIITFSAFNYLLGAVGPTRTATYAYVNPMVAVTLGWAVGGEPVGLTAIGAMALILIAVGVTQWSAARASSTAATAQAATNE